MIKKLASLYVFYPGEYVFGSALFLLTLFVLKRDLNMVKNKNYSTLANGQSNQDVKSQVEEENGRKKF